MKDFSDYEAATTGFSWEKPKTTQAQTSAVAKVDGDIEHTAQVAPGPVSASTPTDIVVAETDVERQAARERIAATRADVDTTATYHQGRASLVVILWIASTFLVVLFPVWMDIKGDMSIAFLFNPPKLVWHECRFLGLICYDTPIKGGVSIVFGIWIPSIIAVQVVFAKLLKFVKRNKKS